MAWSSAALTANEIAYIAADKPVLIGSQVVEDASAGRWVGSGGTIGSADTTDSDYPVRFGYDRLHDLVTAVDSASTGLDHYLIYQMPTGLDFSAAAVIGHNLSGVASTTVSLMISDDGDFTGSGARVETIATWSSAFTSARLVTTEGPSSSLGVKHTGSAALRYTDVEYIALRINKSVAGDITPQVGQLWLGDMVPLAHKANRPYTPDRKATLRRTFETDDGREVSIIKAEGRVVLDYAWKDINDTALITDLGTFSTEMSYGAKPFMYVEDPATAPSTLWVMKADSDTFDLPELKAPNVRTLTLDMKEQAAFLINET